MVRVFGHVVFYSEESVYQMLKYRQRLGCFDFHRPTKDTLNILNMTHSCGHIVIYIYARIHDLFAVEKIKIIPKR